MDISEMKIITKENEPGVTPEKLHRKRAYIFLFIVVILFNYIAGYVELFSGLEYRGYDLFLSLNNQIASDTPPENIVIVAIDEPSMQELNLQWPWPRQVHADLITSLHEAGAAVVAFDIVFSEPSDNKSDSEFADVIKSAGNVILAEDKNIIEESRYQYTTSVSPLPIFKNAANNTGLIWIALDNDSFVRRINLSQQEDNIFAITVAEYYLEQTDKERIKDRPESTFQIPQNLSRPLLINYLGKPRSVKTISYYQALNYRKWLNDEFFKNKIVLVGFNLSAPPNYKVQDHFSYPFLNMANSQISGVEIHANIIDTLLRQRYIKYIPNPVQGLVFFLFLSIGASLLWKKSHWSGALLYTALICLFFVLQFLLFYFEKYIGSIFTPIFFLSLFLVAERIYSYAFVDREKRFIRKAFSHYISPDVVNQIINNPERLNLYGENYETTVLFTDLVGFTTIAERMEPKQLRALLTEYFGEMVDIMLSHKGTLDKFIGDAMMCFFGVPIRTDKHACQATIAAWEMQQRLDKLNHDWSDRQLPDIGMRIGVNTGKVVAGNMGTKNVFNYTIMGDTVNLGARLESANKFYGTRIMLGESTYNMVQGEFDTRCLDYIRVKGKEQAISVYELLGPRGFINQQKAEQILFYEQAFDEYLRQKFGSAIELINQLLQIGPDQPSIVLRERCKVYLSSPPGEEWDGAYTMTSK